MPNHIVAAIITIIVLSQYHSILPPQVITSDVSSVLASKNLNDIFDLYTMSEVGSYFMIYVVGSMAII